MAAARDRRRRICGKCTQARILCVLFWGAVWLWFGARTLRTAGRILACQQFSCACLHAARLGQGLERLQRRIEDSAGHLWRVCGTADPTVQTGDEVSVGQILGRAGSIPNECAEETHIHLEVLQGEQYLDPAKLLN